MDKDNNYEKGINGSYQTDIYGLLQCLKEKKFPEESMVVVIDGDSMDNGEYLETYTIKKKEGIQYLELFEDDIIDYGSTYSLSEEEKEEIELEIVEQLEEIGFDVQELNVGMDDYEMGIMLDSEMMKATYFVYPLEVEKRENISFRVIDYTKALKRLKEGKETYIDYGDGHFQVFDFKKEELLPEIILDSIWAIPEHYPNTDTTPETLNERLAQWIVKESKEKLTVEDALHDIEMYLLLDKLKDMFGE